MDEQDIPKSFHPAPEYDTGLPFSYYIYDYPETHPYGTWAEGWTGASTARWYDTPETRGRGVTFNWCKVDGRQFKPLTTTYDRNYHYAVLKLGTACPPGSTEFSRYFDNEDGDQPQNYDYGNNNWVTGNIWPNSVTKNTHLYFCLFTYGPSTMSAFPVLGRPYGVLARHRRGPEQFLFALDSGYVHADDEDFFNENAFYAPPEIAADASRIIEPYRDYQSYAVTYFHVVKVSDVYACSPYMGQFCGCGGEIRCDGKCSEPMPKNGYCP